MSSPGGNGPVALEDEPAVFVHAVVGAPGDSGRASPGSTPSVALEDEPLTWFEVPGPVRAAPRIGSTAPAGTPTRPLPKAAAPPRSALAATGWSPALWGVAAVVVGVLRLRSRGAHVDQA